MKRRRTRRWVVTGLAVAGLLLLVGLVFGWAAFHHTPSWYQPVEVSRAELTRVRNSLPNTYQSLTDQIVAGKVFEFTISDRTVTEWIVERAELYPESGDWLPPWFHDPVVRFVHGRCILSGRIDYQGWKTVLGIHLAAAVNNDEVTVRVAKVTAGSLPVPLAFLEKPLASLLNDRRLEPKLMPDPLAGIVRRLQRQGVQDLVAHGVSWRNIFELGRRERVIKIRGISASDGELRALIEPR